MGQVEGIRDRADVDQWLPREETRARASRDDQVDQERGHRQGVDRHDQRRQSERRPDLERRGDNQKRYRGRSAPKKAEAVVAAAVVQEQGDDDTEGEMEVREAKQSGG